MTLVGDLLLRFASGKPLTLSKEDERSIANKLERESKRESEKEEKDLETQQREKDATLPVSLDMCSNGRRAGQIADKLKGEISRQ